MPDVPLTLVPWFDAKDNPPKVEKSAWYPTDIGPCYYGEALGMWLATGGRPKPSVWCDPSPPDASDPLGPLTAEDMRDALLAGIKAANDDALICHVGDPNGDGEEFYARRAARLRRALDAIEAKP